MTTGARLAALGITLVVAGAVWIAVRKPSSSAVRIQPRETPMPTAMKPTALPPEILAGGVPQEPGWQTWGWYTYQGEHPTRLWIRVDSIPIAPLGVAARQWRWTVYAGEHTPMATEEYTVPDLLERYRQVVSFTGDPAGAIEAVQQLADDQIAALIVRAAADWIDALNGGT